MANVIKNNTLKPTFRIIKKIPENYYKNLHSWLKSKSLKLFNNIAYNRVSKYHDYQDKVENIY